MRPTIGLAVCVVLAAAGSFAGTNDGYWIVHNFSRQLPSTPEVRSVVDRQQAKVGLASARLDYRIGGPGKSALLRLQPGDCRLPSPGTLKLWVKGDKSGNNLRLVAWHGKAVTDARGDTRYEAAAEAWTSPVRLDFDDWREVEFDFRNLPRDRMLFWSGLAFDETGQKDPRLQGTVLLDDLRLIPPEEFRPEATVWAGLVGPRVRVEDREIVVAVDARSFSSKPIRLRVRLSLIDRNETAIADRDAELVLAPGDSKETALSLLPEDVAPFLPPFRLRGDVLSPDLPDLATQVAETITFGNSYVLFEPFGDLHGGWGIRGGSEENPLVVLPFQFPHVWGNYVLSETYRYCAVPQTALRVRRVEIGAATDAAATPPGPFAMRVEFDGSGTVYNYREPARRYLPGDAFRAGFWIKGDGSGAQVTAIFHDFSDMADNWQGGGGHGGWQRVGLERVLATLDFTGWRYVETDLPGHGLGTHLPKGSTADVDFPLELSALRIDAAGEPGKRKGGVVEFGPILVHTQQRLAEAMAAFAAYDDPNHRYDPRHGAWAVLQNGSPWETRRMNLAWTLFDRQASLVAQGKESAELKPKETRGFRLDLAAQAAAVAKADGPLRLQVTATDAKDVSVATDREIVLAKPDSRACLTGFEEDRGYLGAMVFPFTGNGQGGEVARTSDKTAHGGARSLAIAWDKQNTPARLVSIDPPLPGLPESLSLWVCGDGSGVVFYPVIGDRSGITKGAGYAQWDMFTLRTAGDPVREAVVVDWTGWRELRFRMPPIPPTWNSDVPVLSFVPSYPLGLHLVVVSTNAKAASGTVFVDDIAVETHLPAAERVGLELEKPGESDVLAPPGEAAVWVWNHDLAGPRNVVLRGGAFDWRGRRIAGGETALALNTGERKRVVLGNGIPVGAYAARAELVEGTSVRGSADGDCLVVDMKSILGEKWRDALIDDWRLRGPVESRFELINEDWDWVEHYPGNFQSDTARGRVKRARGQGAEPFLLLGYSAYWAAGAGYEQRKADAFSRRLRDAGHAVDIFLVPERLEDWDDYVEELMRAAGGDVSGWVLWDNPDGSGSLGMKPERFAKFMNAADRWRRVYTPDKPMIIGGMRRETAIPYIEELIKAGASNAIGGVQVRLDLGRLSPEDALLFRYASDLQAAVPAPTNRPTTVVLTDLDWAVEKDPGGLSAFHQAAYLARAVLLLNRLGLRPTVSVANVDFDRLGLGLVYRQPRICPPLNQNPSALQVKPAWWGLANALTWCRRPQPAVELTVQDVWPGRTRCLLWKGDGAAPAAVIWRNDDRGWISFAQTGLEVTQAEDLFGSPLSAEKDEYAVGMVPVRFTLKESGESAAEALRRLRVREEGAESTWPQRTLEAFAPDAATRVGYKQTGGKPAVFTGRTAEGETMESPGLQLDPGGVESFELVVPQGGGLILRKIFFLDETGQQAEVAVNGKPAGGWNLTSSGKELSGGMRKAVFRLDPALSAGGSKAKVEVRYPKGGNTVAWVAFEDRGGACPLTAVGPIHADQNVGAPRFARNIVGGTLRIGDKPFANGLGCFARSLLEFPLNRQYSRFTAQVGVDAATEGKGSVIFEVYGDGEKLWASGVMSGLDAAKAVDLSVAGVDRLRLVVTDGGDGNRFDAADWCDPVLAP